MVTHLRITGLVQGVGYRASFEVQARALRLAGWVRNQRDGSVEALVDGEAEALAQMIAWARCGPPAARVDDVAVSDADDASLSDGEFRLLPTV